MHKKLATKVIMNCRPTAAHKFRARLGSNNMVSFKPKNNQQSVMTKIKSSVERENMQT